MNATTTASPAPRARSAALPSERWSPSLRSYVNVGLFGMQGDTDVASRFRTPSECAEYYERYRNNPLSEFGSVLDDLDEAASIHGLVDERPGETSLNGAAMHRCELLSDTREAMRSGELKVVREVPIGERICPRFRI